MTKVLIIGFGKVGSHIYSIIRKMKSYTLLPPIRSSQSELETSSLAEAGIIFICTQDDKIKSAASEISKSGVGLKGKIVVHTSGSLSSDELRVLKKKGCITSSFHPVQTFNRKASTTQRIKTGKRFSVNNLFKGIYVAIEGEPAAVKVLRRIAAEAGSIPFVIEKEFKVFHHICCVISSSFIIANLSFIKSIYTPARTGRQKNGFKKHSFFDIYKPLIFRTVSNLAQEGIEESLTGPIIRNDKETLRRHIRALKTLRKKEVIDYYKLMSSKVLKSFASKSNIPSQQIQELRKFLNSKYTN